MSLTQISDKRGRFEIGSFYIVFPTPFGDAAGIYTDKPFLISNVLLPQKHKKELVKTIEKDCRSNPEATRLSFYQQRACKKPLSNYNTMPQGNTKRFFAGTVWRRYRP